MKNILLVALIFLGISIQSQAQEEFRCNTPEMNRKALENNPEARARRAALARHIEQYTESKSDREQVYVIPVVFHVVHDYGTENISYEQVEDVVRIMNEDYRKMNPDTSNIVDGFKSLATDSEIEFRLAGKDPWGNCSNGVTRTVSYATNSAGENVKEIAPGWPMASYLNVWVVRNIDSGAAGYAYYPGSVGDGRDGIVVNHSYVGSIGTGSQGRSRTLTHEVGHWLNLPHPWGSTNDPGLASNCDIDDGIEDTPNTIGHSTCALNAATCGSPDNVQNYMDYSYCTHMFTHGQGEMMRSILNSSINGRNNLWTESNLIATGTLDPASADICEASADFSYDVTHGCEGIAVQFTDLTYGTDSISSRQWTFPGGTPEFSDERNPLIVYETAGEYPVELVVTNPAGTDTKQTANAISINNAADGYDLPYYEQLESSDYPGDSDVAENFYTITNGDTGWERQNQAAYSGDYAMFTYLQDERQGVSNAFVTPAIKVDSLQFPLEAAFKIAYSQSDENDTDVLKVYVSENCGENWILQYYKGGKQLHTASWQNPWGTWRPETDEWRSESFILSDGLFDEAESVRLKFEALNRGGNAMYIDDIELRTPTAISEENIQNGFNLYPTNVSNALYLDTEYHGKASVSLYDLSGRVIIKKNLQLSSHQDISGIIPAHLSGLHILKLQTKDGTAVFRINIVK